MCECVSFIPLASVSGCPLPQCVCVRVLERTMYVCVWEEEGGGDRIVIGSASSPKKPSSVRS